MSRVRDVFWQSRSATIHGIRRRSGRNCSMNSRSFWDRRHLQLTDTASITQGRGPFRIRKVIQISY